MEETGDDRYANLKRKTLYYLCDLHSSQGLKGKTYAQLARTWQVTFFAYTFFPGDRKFFRTATMRDESGNVLTDDITMAFVELGKARDFAKKPVNELTPLEMWTIFFGYANRPEYGKVMEAIFRKKKGVGMAGTLLKSISKDERERAHFRSRRMFQTDMEHNLIAAEQRGRERGIAIGEKRGEERCEKRGISIGEKRGEERGITMGEKRGAELREAERKETVMAFKSKGVPVDAIVEVMKLTPDEIKSMGLLPDKKRTKKTPRS